MDKKNITHGTRILLTGGTGFIGSHLAETLSQLGAEVIIPYIELNPKSYFVYKNLSKDTKLIFLNITDREEVLKLIKDSKIDYILHLAAQTTVSDAYADPWTTLNTNIMGTVNILDAARLTNEIKGIIIASSDKAYGKTSKPYKEHFPLKGDHPYDVSKSSTDLISQAYYKSYQTPVVVTRFGNVYGEGDLHFDRIIPGICKALFEKKTFEIRSNGKYVRDYIYVKDVVNGYIALLKKIEGILGEAYNFASSENFSVLELIQKIERIKGLSIPYKILNTAKNEIPYQHLVDDKAKKLGWKQQFTIEQTFQQTLQWYMEILT